MADQEKPGVELPPSSLSHKDLRMLCLDNDLSISGKKSVLVERLLDAGVSWEDLGLESEEEHLEQEELILEESEPMDVEEPIEEDEIFEAEIIEEIKPASTTKITKEESQKDFFKTLLTPKALLSFIIVGLLIGSLFWYVYSQPEPFTADKLRYGDSMTFSISNELEDRFDTLEWTV